MAPGEIYIDGRILVSGKKGHLNLGYPIKFSDMLMQTLALYPNIIPVPPPPPLPLIPAFENGLTYNAITNIATWGGLLNQNTIIDGASSYSVDFDNVLDFTTTAINNTSFSSGNTINITALAALYSSADIIENYAVASILNTTKLIQSDADDIVNNVSTNINNNVGNNIKNNITNNLINNVGNNITNSVQGSINNTVLVDIINTVTGNIQNTVIGNIINAVDGNMTSNVDGDITNTGLGNQSNIITGNIINSSDNVYNNAVTSIINTTPYVFNNIDLYNTVATTSITTSSPLLSNVVANTYSTVNNAFASCYATAFYKSGNGIATNFDAYIGISNPVAGQFSAMESAVGGDTMVSGLYTFKGDCSFNSTLRSARSGSINQASSLDLYFGNLKLENNKPGVHNSKIYFNNDTVSITNSNSLTNKSSEILLNLDRVTINGGNTGVPYNYILPLKTPNDGDIIVADINKIMRFKKNLKYVQSINTVLTPVLNSELHFNVPFIDSTNLIESVSFFFKSNDSSEFTIELRSANTGTLIGTGVTGTPSGGTNYYSSTTLFLTTTSFPAGTYRMILVVSAVVDIANLLEMSAVLNIKTIL